MVIRHNQILIKMCKSLPAAHRPFRKKETRDKAYTTVERVDLL